MTGRGHHWLLWNRSGLNLNIWVGAQTSTLQRPGELVIGYPRDILLEYLIIDAWREREKVDTNRVIKPWERVKYK